MVIRTTRFSNVSISESDLLNFPEGILGFGDLRRFVILDDPHDEIFAWLQSCENPGVAFPLLEPELFEATYKVNLTKGDLETLQLTEYPSSKEKILLFTIVTIPEDPTKMTANLKAPIIINLSTRVARQCVLQDNNLAIREPIFAKLQQRVYQNPGKSLKDSIKAEPSIVRLREDNAPRDAEV